MAATLWLLTLYRRQDGTPWIRTAIAVATASALSAGGLRIMSAGVYGANIGGGMVMMCGVPLVIALLAYAAVNLNKVRWHERGSCPIPPRSNAGTPRPRPPVRWRAMRPSTIGAASVDRRLLTAPELDAMSRDERAAALAEGVVTDLDSLPDEFRQRVVDTVLDSLPSAAPLASDPPPGTRRLDVLRSS